MSLETLQNAVGHQVPDIAKQTGKTANYHYQEMSGKTKSILDRVKIYLDKEEGDTLIQWLCQSQDGFFYRELEYDGQYNLSIAGDILKNFSGLFKTVTESMADGRVDPKESADCRKKWNELKAVVEPFLQGAENGEYDK